MENHELNIEKQELNHALMNKLGAKATLQAIRSTVRDVKDVRELSQAKEALDLASAKFESAETHQELRYIKEEYENKAKSVIGKWHV